MIESSCVWWCELNDLFGGIWQKGKGKGKGAYSSLWIGNPSQSYRASPAIWDYTVLHATRHRWTDPALTPAMQAGTRFTYPGGMEGWVDLGVGYILRWFTCLQTVTHPGTNHLILIATRPGVKPTPSWLQLQRPNRYTTKSPEVCSRFESLIGDESAYETEQHVTMHAVT